MKRALILSSLLLELVSALAYADGFDGQRYVPAAGAAGGFVIERTLVPHHLDYGFGMFLHFAEDPVVVVDEATGDEVARPLHEALTFDVLASMGFFDFAELAVHLPLDLYWEGDPVNVDGETLAAGRGVGDLRIYPKFSIIRIPGFGLGFGLPIRLPSGDDLALRGAGDPTIEPELLLSSGAGRLAFGVNVGYLFHTDDANREGPGGNELTFGASARYRIPTAGEDIAIHLEAFGAWNPSDEGDGFHELPIEVLLGAIFGLTRHWDLYAGISAGLSDGIGAPDVRGILGLRYTNVSFADRDADGILDERDQCPDQAEDKDEFEDDDGFPDNDNDGDRISDDDDECPDAPEDPHGDGDGCPERGRAEYRKGRMMVFGKIRFKSDSAELLPSSDPILDDVAREMKSHREIRRVRVEGHTDNVGDPGYNRKLSRERARSVRQALVKRGVPGRRLDAEGYGEIHPIATNRTLRGRAKNRRVEFHVER